MDKIYKGRIGGEIENYAPEATEDTHIAQWGQVKSYVADNGGGATKSSADNYYVNEYNLPFNGTSGAITKDYVYSGVGNNLIRWKDGVSETLLMVAGTTDWRCVWEHSSGFIFASPMDSYSATIATADHGLYKIDPVSGAVAKVIQLADRECIWGIDEDSAGSIYAGVYSLGSLNADIHKSTDGGDTFTKVLDADSTLLTEVQEHCHAVHVDKSNDAIYICLGDSTTADLNYKSTDGGATWNAVISSNPDQQMTAVLAVEGARLFGTDRAGVGRIYRTTDDINSILVLDTHYQNVFFLRQSDVTGWIYAGFKLDPSATTDLRAEIYVSKDLGQTWTLYNTISGLSAGDGFWYGSEFYKGKMIVGVSEGGNFLNTLIISEDTTQMSGGTRPVSYSRKLTEFDSGKILEVTGTCVLTIPETGLPQHFSIDVDVIAGEATLQAETNVTMNFPNGTVLQLNGMGAVYRRNNSNEYRGNGDFI